MDFEFISSRLSSASWRRRVVGHRGLTLVGLVAMLLAAPVAAQDSPGATKTTSAGGQQAAEATAPTAATPSAAEQPGETAKPNAGHAPPPASAAATVAPADGEEVSGAAKPKRGKTDPHEEENQGYHFAGVFYRHMFVPAFLMDLFLDVSTPANNPGAGVEYVFRKNDFDLIASVWWQGAKVTGPFLGNDDPDVDTEWIDSDLSVIFASATMLWSTPLNDIVALEYGIGVGLGVVLGDLRRTEAYPSNEPGSKDGYLPCNGPSDPNASVTGDPLYCDPTSAADGEDGGHYGAKARRWTDGGSVPNIVPWLAVPHLAVRIKPIKQLMFRVEGGFGLGFFMGASMDYGF